MMNDFEVRDERISKNRSDEKVVLDLEDWKVKKDLQCVMIEEVGEGDVPMYL